MFSFSNAKYEICGDDTCILRSIEAECDHFRVPSVAFSPDGKIYKIIRTFPDKKSSNANIISFRDSSKIAEVEIPFIKLCKSIFILPLSIKRIEWSFFTQVRNNPKIVAQKGCQRFVSTAGSRMIMNHFPFELAYQHSFRKKIFIREVVKIIGYCSFLYNMSITSVVIPSSVEYIDDYAFCDCERLRNIHFKHNSKLRVIGSCSFFSVAAESIVIPPSVVSIRKCAFRYCYHLKSVTFLENSKLKKIGEETFADTAVESVNIPSNVEKLGESSFFNCRKLRSVTFSEGSKLKAIRKLSFSVASIESVVIPSNVEEIEDYSFNMCKNLISVIFPNDSMIRIIGKKAFFGCPNIDGSNNNT